MLKKHFLLLSMLKAVVLLNILVENDAFFQEFHFWFNAFLQNKSINM